VSEGLPAQLGVHWHPHRPHRYQREDQHHVFDAVGHQDGHAVSPPQPHALQCTPQSVHGGAEVGDAQLSSVHPQIRTAQDLTDLLTRLRRLERR
jgi:hypothetical protein